MPTKLYLIDGHAQTYRAYYAMESLTSPDGQPTGAIFGFTRMLLDLRKTHKPEYIAVVFDAPGKTFRHDVHADYKATRKPPPPALLEQLPVIQEVVEGYGIPTYMQEGYEADDLIGTLARQAREQDMEVVLVSGDKDLAQLLEDGVIMFDPKKDTIITAETFTEKNGIPPERLPDAMGLWGDTSDNIPGVPGIGQKGALKLIKEYGTLDALLEKADEIKGKRGESLRDNIEIARLSRQLATIDRNSPVQLDLKACHNPESDEKKLLEIFDRFSLESLKKKLSIVKEEKPEDRSYTLVNTPKAFEGFMLELNKQKSIAFDVETTSIDPLRAELVGMSFSWQDCTGYYLPFMAPEGENTLGKDELAAIKKILEDKKIGKTGHNLKYDSLVMRRYDIYLAGIDFDSMLASHLLAGHVRGHSMDAAATRFLQVETIPIKDLIGTGKKQITINQVPLEKVTEYAAEDADIAWRLRKTMEPQIKRQGLEEIFTTLDLPLAEVLTDMQELGIGLNSAYLAAMNKDMEKQLEHLTGEIHYLAGREFNIASPKQLAEILFDELGFEVVRKTKTGRSTDEGVLTALMDSAHEKKALPKLVLQHRMYSKLKSTYIEALPEMVNPDTGRIHTSFNQTGTVTGRLSSSDPNLQNIPVKSEEGRGIRAAFVPCDGWIMLAADYSQIELRMLAHLSGDEELSKAFREGKDIHRAVAAQVYGVNEDDVTAAQRRSAKAVNFGIVYGQTAFGLSSSTDMSRSEAQDFIDKYFSKYPKVNEFIANTIAEATEKKYVETILGRRREIPELGNSNRQRREHAERMAVNTVVQGSAAELIKRAMINLHTRLHKEGMAARMLLQIHDELVLESPKDELEKLKNIVADEMEKAMQLDIPVVVDIGCGSNWLEAK